VQLLFICTEGDRLGSALLTGVLGQTVSIGWEEEQEVSRIQIGVAECVETKTVTTTTTTKRSYPPLLVRQQPLASLDPKKYPLALKDTPPELAKFSFELDGQMMDFDEGVWHNEVRRILSICFDIQ
jgi:F-box and WD-40 domain protein CDC4